MAPTTPSPSSSPLLQSDQSKKPTSQIPLPLPFCSDHTTMNSTTHQQQQQMKRKKKVDVDKILLRFVWTRYCLDTKLLLTSLFLLSSLFTFLHLLPTFRLSSSTTACFFSPPLPSPPPPTASVETTTNTTDHHYHYIKQEEQQHHHHHTKRAFHAVGTAAFLFVHMGTYRAGPNSFAVIGLSSKPLHVYANPVFSCHWLNHSSTAVKLLPDWGYGRIYTVVVLNCTFDSPVGADGSGGELILHTSTAGGDGNAAAVTERIVVLSEAPGDDRVLLMLPSSPKYDILYCGSPLYGNLSPQRVREWLAYHVKLFGRRSHFVLYDAGGVHGGVMEVLKPWMEMGYLSLHDIKELERFDGYYHNQFLVVNDCLHRYRLDAKWMFFFDVDEFIYVSPRTTLEAVLDGMSGMTQFTFEQRPMSDRLCLTRDSGRAARMWGIEKMVYRDVKRGIRRDRKYALQPRNAFATGVHMSQNIVGKSVHRTDGIIKYFHYHGTINYRREPCKQFIDQANLTYEGTPYVLDTTLRLTANSIKKFELDTIGKRLQRTRQ